MNLREFRYKRGLRRNYVAEIVGVCGKHLNDIEGGRVNLTNKVAEKLSDLYQLSLEEVVQMYKEGAEH